MFGGTNQGHPRYPWSPARRTVLAMIPGTGPSDIAHDTETAPDPAPVAPVAPADRIIGGVAGTIAYRLGLDPLWVRLGFVVVALAGGVGVLLYAALWSTLIAYRYPGWGWLRFAGGALAIVGVPLLLNAGPNEFVSGPLAVVLLLIGLACALWRPRADAAWFRAQAPPGPAPAPAPSLAFGTGPATAAWQPPAAPLPAPARREPSLLGRATSGAAIAVAAVWAIADEADGGRLHPEQWLGAAAAICGVGLLIGAVMGRAKWLVLPAAAFAGVGFVSGLSARLGVDPGDTFGDRHIGVGSYSTASMISERVTIGGIDIGIDGVPPQPVTIDARVGIGDIDVQLFGGESAEEPTVEIHATIDNGSARGPSGPFQVLTIGPEGPPDVIINARIIRGDLRVNQYDSRGLMPPMTTPPTLPPAVSSGQLTPVADGIAATADGWLVFGDGEAVLDPQDRLIVGDEYETRPGITGFSTSHGLYELLPRSLLLTPYREVLDLTELRARAAAAVPPTDPTLPVTAPPETTTLVPTTGG